MCTRDNLWCARVLLRVLRAHKVPSTACTGECSVLALVPVLSAQCSTIGTRCSMLLPLLVISLFRPLNVKFAFFVNIRNKIVKPGCFSET